MNRIKKTREEKGLQQKQLAQRAKVSVRALQNYESGERIPDVHTAQRIANELDSEVKNIFPLPK